MITSTARSYRATEVCQLTGVTYRQLDYYARTGVVEPSIREATGSGSQRLYSPSDLLAVALVARLLRSGVSLQRIRQIFAGLSAVDPLHDRDQWAVFAPHRVFITASPADILEAIGTGQVVTVLSIGRVADQLFAQ